MPVNPRPYSHKPDSAGIFACAHSLWEACQKRSCQDSSINLSEDYNGWDQLMREVMRIGVMFESWACEHVVFEECTEVWPYHLGDHFGDACLSVKSVSHLARFNESDCLRVALRLRLPIYLSDGLAIPVDVKIANSIPGSGLTAFRIMTVRASLDDSEIIQFTIDDDPFDGKFSPPYFGIYGVSMEGLLEHIADRPNYEDALQLLRNLMSNAAFPDLPKR